MLHLSRKMIMFKAKEMDDEKNKDPATQEGFTASRGWLEKFMRRHGLSFRRRTTTSQKDLTFMIDCLVITRLC